MNRKLHSIGFQFVEFVPETLAPGILYISLEYKTMAHLCFCGCGTKVVTPLSPTGWNLSFDGRTVSVTPSIGNWNLKCKSHYVISGSRVEWHGAWTKEQITAGFARDQAAKLQYYGQKETVAATASQTTPPPRASFISRIIRFLFG